MRHEDYPALFLDADNASNAYQKTFLRLIVTEYAALFAAAVFSMSIFSGSIYAIIYAASFLIGLLVLISRAQSKPDQWWYRCRALAESVKTLTWRYMMHAAPFDVEDSEARSKLRAELNRIFQDNTETARRITEDWSGNDQITQEMESVRTYSREGRLEYYLDARVRDQRTWYRKKARSNRRAAKAWVWASGICYVSAGLMALSRIAFPLWPFWPIEPLIVFAASIVGWMQIKKFNELSAAYTLTAHEIGLISPMVEEVKDDASFSEFINDAEKAFSREHTLWLARQSD